MKDIKLIDDRGMFYYSYMYQLCGEDIEILKSSKIVSLAGTPSKISIVMEAPHSIASNPARKLKKGVRYDVIIIEHDVSET